MVENINKRFIEIRKDFDEKNMLIYTIAYNIAPTIYYKKPSSILNLTHNGSDFYRLWEVYKQDFSRMFPVETFEIKRTSKNILILFYYPSKLGDTLKDRSNMNLLKECGYNEGMKLDEFLNTLKVRFKNSCPHEVGIFLGIPSEDVRGFIKNLGRDYLINGYWKVYNDFQEACKTFSLYDNAKLKILQLMGGFKS